MWTRPRRLSGCVGGRPRDDPLSLHGSDFGLRRAEDVSEHMQVVPAQLGREAPHSQRHFSPNPPNEGMWEAF